MAIARSTAWRTSATRFHSQVLIVDGAEPIIFCCPATSTCEAAATRDFSTLVEANLDRSLGQEARGEVVDVRAVLGEERAEYFVVAVEDFSTCRMVDRTRKARSRACTRSESR